MAIPASDAIAEAQVLLNDPSGISYTTAKLLPVLNKAYRELQTKLQKAGQPTAKEVTDVITVTAGTTELADGGQLPGDLLYPINLYELINSEYVKMIETSWEPFEDQTDRLRYWNWREDSIKLLGATSDRDVKIRYMKGLPSLTGPTSSILILNSLTFLAARTGAIAALVIGENPTRAGALDDDAKTAWEDLKMTQVKQRQSRPVRRRTNRFRR
jgi:hypothetical protein